MTIMINFIYHNNDTSNIDNQHTTTTTTNDNDNDNDNNNDDNNYDGDNNNNNDRRRAGRGRLPRLPGAERDRRPVRGALSGAARRLG